MTTRFRGPMLLLAGALLLTACGGSVAATVDGRTITSDEVLAIRTAYDGEPVVSGESFRQDLTNLIISEALLSAAERDFGRSDLEQDAAIDAFLADPGTDAAVVDGLRASPDFTEAALRRQAVLLLIRREATRELVRSDPAYLEQTFVSFPERVTQVCASHILVATEDEARQVLRRLDAGDDFATVAAETSLDTQSVGGRLPCPAFASQYVDGFSTAVAVAPIGVPFGPVESQFGFHVIEVEQRTAPATLEEFVADPTAYLDPAVANELFITWIDGALASASVSVDPAIGTWLPEADGIVPPPA